MGFDVFRFANNFVVWECLRDEEFAPLKNAEGASDFTPTHCRNSLLALHQKWLRIAGASSSMKMGKKQSKWEALLERTTTMLLTTTMKRRNMLSCAKYPRL